MASEPRLIFEQPLRENSIPVELYRASSPEKFSLEDDDKFVLYGGGSNYELRFLESTQQTLHVDNMLQNLSFNNISLFILNTCVIIWFNLENVGLELPYQLISLHAVTKNDNNSTKLYLQIISNKFISSTPKVQSEFITTTEIEIIDNKQLGNSNPIFKTQSKIEELYFAMSKCAQFHLDPEDEDEIQAESNNLPALEIPQSWLNEYSEGEILIPNSGDADDLEGDADIELSDNQDDGINGAGMYVDVGYASIAGSVRKRESDVQAVTKNRRIH